MRREGNIGLYNESTITKLNQLETLPVPTVTFEWTDPDTNATSNKTTTIWERIAGEYAKVPGTFITPDTYGKDTDDERNVMSEHYTPETRSQELAKYDLTYGYQCQYNSEETESPVVNAGDSNISLGNVSNIKAQLIFGPNGDDNTHWLASRSVLAGAEFGFALFCLGTVLGDQANSGLSFITYSDGYEAYCGIRFASRNFPSSI